MDFPHPLFIQDHHVVVNTSHPQALKHFRALFILPKHAKVTDILKVAGNLSIPYLEGPPLPFSTFTRKAQWLIVNLHKAEDRQKAKDFQSLPKDCKSGNGLDKACRYLNISVHPTP